MISVVIPALNEEDAIGLVIEEVKTVLSGREYEIVVVNDGSTDATGQTARDAGATVVDHPHNIGYGRSLKDGIHAAKYDIIVIADADGSYPIEEIPRLVEEFQKGFNMVVGQRTGANYLESVGKTILRHCLKWLVEFTTGRKIPDINSGLRVFSKKEVIHYFPHLCDSFSFTTSMTLGYMMTGKFVTYLEIPYKQRIGVRKVKLLRDSIKTLQLIIQAILFYNPIKLFLVICFFQAVFTLLVMCFSFFFPFGNRVLIACISVFFMILVFAIGLLVDQLRQVHGN